MQNAYTNVFLKGFLCKFLKKVRIEEIAHFVKADLVKSPLDGITDINMLFNGTGTTRPNLSKTLISSTNLSSSFS